LKQKASIHITGIVQGVGFRPFVYRAATGLSLVGYVLNLGDAGVSIVVEGEKSKIECLINEIHTNPPSISKIDTIDVDWSKPTGSFAEFFIEKSSLIRGKDAIPKIPPDIAICEQCIVELYDPNSRWYLYPFTSCAACGPRYSTITDLPYDRPNTTMHDFPLCNTCNIGYTNPYDRRYHAQTTACQNCGPNYSILDSRGTILVDSNPIIRAAELLSQGSILAIQGIGGTHLATKTTNPNSIHTLRIRKRRLNRPFAIMIRNVESLYEFSLPTPDEIDLMKTWRRPIVLVKKKENKVINNKIPYDSLEQISPGLDTIGVMLPYAPLHHLLFKYIDEPALVMTSANPTGVPMYIHPNIIVSELSNIADYFLVHNRRIHQRSDDSVVKFVLEKTPVFLRRARGYVPEPLVFEAPWKHQKVIAVGPEEKATGAVVKSGRIFTTQHIGDTDRLENIQFLSEAINNLLHLLGVDEIDSVACDLHPEFLSTEFAEQLAYEKQIPLIRIQHHFAHLASIMVDASIPYNTNITCITADGYGYGDDGTAWGGEILVGNFSEYEKCGGLEPHEYPGGDLSAKYAIRPLLGILGKHMNLDEIISITQGSKIAPNIQVSKESLQMLFTAIKNKVNTIVSSSTGRFLDAVSIALGICSENTYDAECPMKLESIARKTDVNIKPSFIQKHNHLYLNTTESLRQILDLRKKGVKISALAYAAQWHVGEALAQIACNVSSDLGIKHVGFSGGVALNRIITQAVVSYVSNYGLQPLIHKKIPPGDGGVSIGQAAIAGSYFSDN
jgi:hydrogenase maturation protein HypF